MIYKLQNFLIGVVTKVQSKNGPRKGKSLGKIPVVPSRLELRHNPFFHAAGHHLHIAKAAHASKVSLHGQ